MEKYTRPYFDTSAFITIDVRNDFTLHDAPARIPGSDGAELVDVIETGCPE